MQPEDTDRLIKQFRERYPFIEAKYFRAGSAPLTARIMTETRAGQHLADVISGKVSDLIFLKAKGVLGRLRSAELQAYQEKFKDPESGWVDLYTNYYAIGYNTKEVKEADIPRRWEDLLDPKWSQGKIALDTRSYDWFFGMLEALGRDRGTQFMRRLRDNRPTLREGNVLIANLLAAGEFPLAITYAHLIERTRSRGAPVDWLPLKPMIAVPISLAVPRRSPHPNAAELFVDLVLSKDGAAILRDMGRVPTRSDMEPSAKRLDPKSLDLFPLHVSGEELDPKEFRKIFGVD
jgi:iron(III) transport system substrate-binding protein